MVSPFYFIHCRSFSGDGPGAAGPEAATSLLERLCSEYKEQMAQLDKARVAQVADEPRLNCGCVSNEMCP